jgi:serine/threonine protein kinase
MRTRPDALEMLLGGEFFETISRYKPNADDYQSLVRSTCPGGWSFDSDGVWFYAMKDGLELPPQGWKIHLSASAQSSRDLLLAVLPVLWRLGLHFKCAADRLIISFLTSKASQRGGSGKFITVYPGDEDTLLRALADLNAATGDLTGPYILSDRRYRSSRVVFYRYGGFQRVGALQISGRESLIVKGPDGSTISDDRNPFFAIPPWVTDPVRVEDLPKDAFPDRTLKEGSYLVKRAFSFSNTGGVYLAEDQSTNEVVIKEARPAVNWISDGSDAIELLRKEYRILELLQDTGVTPKPLDFFKDWEHHFLVEEYIQGTSLWNLAANESILLRVNPSEDALQSFYERFRQIAINLCDAVALIHERGVVLADLSPRNILVAPESSEVRLIDFEAACQEGVDTSTGLGTPGFKAPKRNANAVTCEDDFYSLGAVLLSYVFRATEFVAFQPESAARIVSEVCADARIPQAVREVLTKSLSIQREDRPSPRQVCVAFERNSLIGEPSPEARARPDLAKLSTRIRTFIEGLADTTRSDRLFPADYRVFRTNPISLAYGATGIFFGLQRSGLSTPSAWMDWLRQQPIDRDRYTHGFGIGMAGVAWAMLELGLLDEARSVLDKSFAHPLLGRNPTLFYGDAGWGMTNLKFFHATGDERYLREALTCAQSLIASSKVEANGRYWEVEGTIPVGLFYGSSGIALFLLYAALFIDDAEMLSAAREAMLFDLAQGIATPEGRSWPYTAGNSDVTSPYVDRGTAGVGIALLRFIHLGGMYELTGELDALRGDTIRKYTYNCSRYFGLAGIGDFHLDLYEFESKDDNLNHAYRALEGILMYSIDKGDALAFPGAEQTKIACDYGTGMAGVLSFIERLRSGGPSDFLLDRYYGPRRDASSPTIFEHGLSNAR